MAKPVRTFIYILHESRKSNKIIKMNIINEQQHKII